jgi:hypothetical protein
MEDNMGDLLYMVPGTEKMDETREACSLVCEKCGANSFAMFGDMHDGILYFQCKRCKTMGTSVVIQEFLEDLNPILINKDKELAEICRRHEEKRRLEENGDSEKSDN